MQAWQAWQAYVIGMLAISYSDEQAQSSYAALLEPEASAWVSVAQAANNLGAPAKAPWQAWESYTSSILGHPINNAEDSFNALAQSERDAWAAVVS